MGPNQTYKLFHGKGNHKQNEKTIYGMGENTCKWCDQQWLSLQNKQQFIQLKNKQRKASDPVEKWTEDLNRHFSKEDMQLATRHMKRCSTLLIIKETQIKTTVRCCPIPVSMVIIKMYTNNKCWSVEKIEPFSTVGGNVSWCSHYGRQYGSSSEN